MFRKVGAKRGTGGEDGGEEGEERTRNFVSRLYLHKIVVVDAFEDNEMKLNK